MVWWWVLAPFTESQLEGGKRVEPTPSPSDIFAAVRTRLRQQRELLARATAQDVVILAYRTAAIRRQGVPTASDILTAFLELRVVLDRLERAIRHAYEECTIERTPLCFREFWRTRISRCPEALQARAAALRDITEAAIRDRFAQFGGWVSTPEAAIEDELLRSSASRDDDLSHLFREHQEMLRALGDEVLRMTTDRCGDLFAASGLPETIIDDLRHISAATADHPNPFAVIGGIGEWRKGIADAIAALELPTRELRVAGSDRMATVEDLAKRAAEASDEPPSCMTSNAHRVMAERERIARWQRRDLEEWERRDPERAADAERACWTFMLGALSAIRGRWESIDILHALAEIGVTPGQNAERVIERAGRMGRPAAWYCYPTTLGHTACIAVHPSDPHEDSLLLVRGSLDDAITYIQERFHARELDDERRVIDAPRDVTRNVFDVLHASERVAEYCSRDREVREWLASTPA